MINGANVVTDVYTYGFVTFHTRSWDDLASKSLSIYLQHEDKTQLLVSKNCVDPEPNCREMVISGAAKSVATLDDGLYNAYAVAEDQSGKTTKSNTITFEVFKAQPAYTLQDQSDLTKNIVRLTLNRQKDSFLHPYDFLRIFRNGNIIKSVPLNQPFEPYVLQDDVSWFPDGPLTYDFALSYGAADLLVVKQTLQLKRTLVVLDYNIGQWSGSSLIRFKTQTYDSNLLEARLYRDNLLVDTHVYEASSSLGRHTNIADYPAPETGVYQYTIKTINSKGETFTTPPLTIDVSKPHTFE